MCKAYNTICWKKKSVKQLCVLGDTAESLIFLQMTCSNMVWEKIAGGDSQK